MSRVLKIVVAGTDPQGDNDWYFVKVRVPDDFEITEEDSAHLLTAMLQAEVEGWAPITAYDETCKPFDILKIAGQWGTFTTVDLDPGLPGSLQGRALLGRVAFNAFMALVSLTEMFMDGALFTRQMHAKLRGCLDLAEIKTKTTT